MNKNRFTENIFPHSLEQWKMQTTNYPLSRNTVYNLVEQHMPAEVKCKQVRRFLILPTPILRTKAANGKWANIYPNMRLCT